MTIDQWIVEASANTPNKPAIISDHDTLSYDELRQAITQVVNGLLSCCINHGDRIAWYGLNQPDAFILLFACARLGAILVPLNWRLADAEIHEIIDDCTPKMIVHDHHFAEKANLLSSPLISSLDDLKNTQHHDLHAASVEDSLLLVYTSGSTGRPKGVVLSQEALIANAEMSIEAHQMQPSDNVLNVLPLFHVGGLNILPTPAFSIGATVILHEGFDPEHAIAALAQANLMIVVPTVLQVMIAHPAWASADLSVLRAFSIGSTDVPVALIEAVHAQGKPVIQIYGATETSPFAIYQSIDEAFTTVGSIGRAGRSCEVSLQDHDGNILGDHQVGEICVRGRNILREYWKDPELTKKSIRDGWFHTGDMAQRDEEGLFWFADRIKHIIISGGENIYPAEVERVLRACPGVVEVAVVGKPDPRWGEVPVAVVKTEANLTEDEIINFMQNKVARYKQPRSVVFMDELPKNAMNKIVVDEIKKKLT